MNGIVNPDRTSYPGIYEVKKVYQNIGFKANDIKNGRITIKNKRFFTNLSDCLIKWELVADSKVVETGDITPVDIEPQTEKNFTLNFNKLNTNSGAECFVNLYAINISKSTFIPYGHIIASEQFKVTEKELAKTSPSTVSKISVNETKEEILIDGIDFIIRFSKENGASNSFVLNGYELIKSPMAPDF